MFRGLLVATSLAIAGGAGYLAGSGKLPYDLAALNSWSAERPPTVMKTQSTGRIIYYRDPDRKREYSAKPRKTADGRDFVAVHQSEDVSFEARREAVEKPKDAEQPKQVSAERKVLYYRNPMGLPDTSPVPKKDSMGMDYIPVLEGEDSDPGTVKVSQGKQQKTGVKSVEAKLARIGRKVKVPGTVAFDERRMSVVAMRTDAFVETVADVTTGDRVRKGEPLFQFFSKDIAGAAAELVAARAERTPANSGAVLRLRNFGLSPETIDTIRKAREVPERLTFSAPVSGVILERMATAGMMAASGEKLFSIADTSKVWVIAEVPESQLDDIGKDAVASVSVRSLPGKSFEGRVSLIYPEIRAETRTAKVRIEIDNPNGELLANMYADVQIETSKAAQVVAVPNSAVIDTGDRQVVFLDRGDGRFEPKDVKLGARGEDETEIMSGVKAGDKVVVAANFLLDAESNLTSALSSMSVPKTDK
jgi:Cu(I)/Ag(I) efflux system membrane fusion protein